MPKIIKKDQLKNCSHWGFGEGCNFSLSYVLSRLQVVIFNINDKNGNLFRYKVDVRSKYELNTFWSNKKKTS